MKSIALFVFIVVFVPFGANAQSDWPMASRDREQTSWARDELTFAPPFDMRVIQCPAPVAEAFDKYSPFIVYAQGMLYLSIDNTPNWLHALNPLNGASPWHGIINGSCCSVNTSPAVIGNVVVQGGHNFSAMLTGFDRVTGSVLWEKPTGSMNARNVVADEGKIYYRLEAMTCLDAATGDEVWTIPLPGYPNVGTPAVDESTVYYSYEDTLFAVNKSNGERKWFIAGAGHEGLSVDTERVYFNRDDVVFAADKFTGAIVWKHDIPGDLELAFINGNSIAIDDRYLVYIIWADKDSLATLTALDKSSGTFQWTHVFPGEGTFTPTIANGIVYIVNWKTRTLWGIELASGDVVFQENSRQYWAQPIIAHGTMYVNSPNDDSTGYAVAAFTPKASSVDLPASADGYGLSVYPHPVTSRATFSFNLATASMIQLDLYDILGHHLATLERGHSGPGIYEKTLSRDQIGPNIGPGMYVLRLQAGGVLISRPLLIAP